MDIDDLKSQWKSMELRINQLEKDNKSDESRYIEMIKIKAEINETENESTIKIFLKACSSLVRYIKEKREMTQS